MHRAKDTVKDRLAVIRAMLLAQLGAALLVAAVSLWFGQTIGLSALLGGLICLIPNAYFAFRVFRHRGARAAQLIVRSFYAGEAAKLMLTAAMFGFVFAMVKPLSAPALFIAYLAVLLTGWLALLIVPIVWRKTGRSTGY